MLSLQTSWSLLISRSAGGRASSQLLCRACNSRAFLYSAAPLRPSPETVCSNVALIGAGTPARLHRRSLQAFDFSAVEAPIDPAAVPPPGPQPQPYFADFRLDRAAHLRSNADRIAELLVSPEAKLVALHNNKSLVASVPASSSGNGTSLSEGAAACLTADGVPAKWVPAYIQPASVAQPHIIESVFLGLEQDTGAAVFAALFKDGEQAIQLAGDAQKLEFVDVRRQGPHMTSGDAAMLALANGLIAWHTSTAYDAVTGHPLTSHSGGHSRMDDSTGRQVYPRIDPAVIMLVLCGDYALLGRQSRWVPGRYSLLAGFAEIGETLEQAVAREVHEEANVVVEAASIRYHSSQPWPFPKSLMIGFTAAAMPATAGGATGFDLLQGEGRRAALGVGLLAEEVSSALHPQPPAATPDTSELEDARWFHRDWLHAAALGSGLAPGQGTFAIPGRYALAGIVIRDWLQSSSGASCSEASWAGHDIAQVDLDEGTFKYVLLRLSDAAGSNKLLVRGRASAAYHAYVLGEVKHQVQELGLQVEPLGGGRIRHDAGGRSINIYGYSVAFGAAPHEVTAALCRRWYPLYDDISISYEGY